MLAAMALAAPSPAPSDSPSVDTTIPSDPAEALKELQSLGESAFQQAKEEVSGSLARRGRGGSGHPQGCTLDKLQIRREW